MGILIKGGEIVTASDRFTGDVRVEGETIVAIGRNLPSEDGDEVYDASGKFVLPGAIDVHVHLALPFMGTVSRDDFDSGTRAAICGGTTSLIDFCIPAKGEGLFEALDTWNRKSEGKAHCDYGYHMAITDWNDQIRDELPRVFEKGITSFKIFTAYKGALMISDEQLFNLMLEVRKLGGLVTAHAVNGDVLNALATRFAEEGKLSPHYHPKAQPERAEGEATGRVYDLAAIAEQAAYVVHMTCEAAIERLARARARGEAAYGETCTQYLLLDDSLYGPPEPEDFEGAKYVLSPPLRKKKDQKVLWDALKNGILQVVGTDHCTFDFKTQKTMGKDDFRKIPNGFNGLEERFKLLYTHGVVPGRISMNRLVEVACTNPARLFGMYPKKGVLAVGSDADIQIFDPNRTGTISAAHHFSECDYNVYEGYETAGEPTHVFVRGKLMYEEGDFHGEPGHGRFLKREGGSLI